MQQKDLRVHQEVAVSGYGGLRRAKILNLGVNRNFSSRADGVRIEHLETPGQDRPEPGTISLVTSRDIEAPWEEAEPKLLEQLAKRDEEDRLREEGRKRAADLADAIDKITGAESNVEVERGRELGRDPANRPIRQQEGERVSIDTAAVERLVELAGENLDDLINAFVEVRDKS